LDPLTAEYKRVRMNTEIMLDHGSFSDEVPLRIHSRTVDGRVNEHGAPLRWHPRSEVRQHHDGLGSPAFDERFWPISGQPGRASARA